VSATATPRNPVFFTLTTSGMETSLKEWSDGVLE
jgi:hypothetical protein